eukprot:gene9552-10539_t
MVLSGKAGIVISVAVLILALGISLLIAGIVIKNKDNAECKKHAANTGNTAKRVSNPAFLSFVAKVQKTYYKINPNKIIYMPDVTDATVRQEFSAYDARPIAIKRRTDTARALYNEITGMKLNEQNMIMRERKALAQVKHYLQNNFDSPYDENYYAGDWMMGPNYFCWQPICYIGNDLRAHFGTSAKAHNPSTLEDVEFVIASIKKHGQSAIQYMKNMQYGVKAGMVRSVMDCQSGYNSIRSRFPKVARGSATGSTLCNALLSVVA